MHTRGSLNHEKSSVLFKALKSLSRADALRPSSHSDPPPLPGRRPHRSLGCSFLLFMPQNFGAGQTLQKPLKTLLFNPPLNSVLI